ncbi:hypothetical protein OPV22_023124 [Ensete ventricosum]|uniref:Uncharacterized protein n=1 Tax=Ensete ventricosum TaxID=4639 RepID=A0AAV8QL34_ENSVE|nr:hypothetical protein OPV22_023124 [Ensete ventricosum]
MSNTGEVLLTKAISGVLPRLAYLNKQPIKKDDRRRREVGSGYGCKGGSKTKHQQSIYTRKYKVQRVKSLRKSDAAENISRSTHHSPVAILP